jgi:hypothetical protein
MHLSRWVPGFLACVILEKGLQVLEPEAQKALTIGGLAVYFQEGLK